MVLCSEHDKGIACGSILSLAQILCVVTYENECKTKKKTNWNKDKIEQQQIHSTST